MYVTHDQKAVSPTNESTGTETSSLSLGLYALPSLPIAFLYLPAAILIPAYYSSALHVSLQTVGAFLLLSRGLDVVLDPLIGKWCDTTRSGIGRRKLWMLLASPLLMVGAYMLFFPPPGAGGWYLLLASFTTYAGGSAVSIPYYAWGTELAVTYHGRARMAAFRGVAGVVGSLLGAAVPAITARFHHGIDAFTISTLGWMIILLTPACVIAAVIFVEEPPAETPLQTSTKWLRSIPELLANRPFRILCGAFLLFNMGAGIANATLVFFVTDYLLGPTFVGPAMLAAAATTIIAVPFWLQASKRVGKHHAAVYSLYFAVGIFAAAIPFLQPGQGIIFVAIMAILGAVSSGYATLPVGIIGDVIDFDALTHGSSRGGLYWGVWTFAQKVTPALSIAIALPFLDELGFHPGTHNTPLALQGLKYTFCFGTAPFLVAGALLLNRFPIDSHQHALIRSRLSARSGNP